MKWCDEVQRQIFEGILTHLSNYMLNWPKIICHPSFLSLSLSASQSIYFPFFLLSLSLTLITRRHGFRIAGFKAQKPRLNRAKAPGKLIAANKQHDCLQVLCASLAHLAQNGGAGGRSGRVGRGVEAICFRHT